MRAMILLVTLLVGSLVAGCISSDDDTDPSEGSPTAFRSEVTKERAKAVEVDLSTVIDSDHGGHPALHAVPELHEGSLGLELVGYNPLTRPGAGDPPGAADSGYGAIDTWKHLVCVTHFAGSTGALGGATIVDISDPADPVVLSSLLSAAVNSDCQFTDDGKYLILATYAGASTGLGMLPPPVGDVGSNGLSVYAMDDPANPEFLFHDTTGVAGVSFQDVPVPACTGCAYHNVFTAQINGTHYIFQTYTGNILTFNADMTGLEIVSTIPHSDHDLWVGQHPISGEYVIVTGAENGTAVFNADDPANPELLGIWEGDPDNRSKGWHRQWPLENTVDGRAYLVVAGEECGNGDSLPYTVLDWTDPTTLVKTGQWWIPGHPANPGYSEYDHLCEMNSHEFEVWDGYVATGNYHAGVWLIDVGTTERAHEPATIGYYLPSEKPHEHGGTVNVPFAWSPDVWGAYFDERGYIIAADWWSGLYVLKFEGTHTGDAAAEHEHQH